MILIAVYYRRPDAQSTIPVSDSAYDLPIAVGPMLGTTKQAASSQ